MKRHFYLLAILFALVLGSCRKQYLDINDNPNSPTESSITPDLILPLALHRVAAQTGAGYATQARWMGYWTRGGDYGPNNEEETYQITTNFGTGVWSNWYDILTDVDIMEKKAKASGQPMYEAIGKTLKVVGFMNLVDVYNNVPYTRAFDIGGNITPTYDKGEDIYKDFFVKLDEAMVLLNAASGSDVKISTADIMFGGNTTQWKKLVNTIRLKLVLRLSQTTLITPATELAKVSGEGFLGTGESASVQPGYKKAFSPSNASQQNPFWDTYEQDVAGVFLDRFNRANNYTLNLLRTNSDIRYTYYFDRADSPLGGNLYFGYDYGVPQNSVPSASSSRVSGPGLARSFDQAQWFLTSVESMFLQAEAAQRGWIAVAPRAAYEAAVRESFRWLGVTNADAEAAAYLSGSLASWNGTLKQVMTQKYLALVGINNFEAWTDYRRLTSPSNPAAGDYPNVPLSLAPNRGANIPLRYRYPQSEYNYNAANVAAQGDPDPLTSPIFWDK
ncbi:MAG: SusD/RagB family nutrient-binding outer membrane lipoprotein [Pedobacter sp.]|nr:MAG: SusD/RagB family nutrient-binding outer membrane lipoprotein [Pedobacter sp.]